MGIVNKPKSNLFPQNKSENDSSLSRNVPGEVSNHNGSKQTQYVYAYTCPFDLLRFNIYFDGSNSALLTLRGGFSHLLNYIYCRPRPDLYL